MTSPPGGAGGFGPPGLPGTAGAASPRFWVSLVAVALVVAVGGGALAGGRAAAPEPSSQPVEDPVVALAAPPPPDGPFPPPVRPPGASPEPPAVEPAAEPPVDPPPPPEVDRVQLVAVDPRLRVFAGLSTWIDLYDVQPGPEEQVAQAAAAGVEALYVQSARFNSPADIHDPERLARTIEAAHDHGLEVMLWYLPDHVDPALDLRRAQAAIAFTTPRGDRADAFGLDIEHEAVTDIGLRSANLLATSAALRAWAGPDYPLAAIVLPPLQLDLRPSWWPAFPFAELRAFYDVYVPMSYSSFRDTGADYTYSWNLENVLELRRRAGDPNLPVHLAGGIADNLPHVDRFVEAARDARVVGAGLYDLDTTPPQAWVELRRLRTP